MMSCNFLIEKAFAKVNFNLNVLPPHADGPLKGYHDIESIFQTIDLYDELIIEYEEKPVSFNECSVVCHDMDLPESNTLTNAYNAFCEVVTVPVPMVWVTLKKGIPSGGGLGGGSSDAAALVRGLEKICGIKLSAAQIDFVAGKTGSDVFFFMNCDSEGRGCALVSGRGEKVQNIIPRKDLFLLLIFPEFSSSTKEAYSYVDADMESDNKKQNGPCFSELESVYRLDPEKWTFRNTFTSSLCSRYIVLKNAMMALKRVEAKYFQMSGSGSTFFGVFTLEKKAVQAMSMLKSAWNCKVVQVI